MEANRIVNYLDQIASPAYIIDGYRLKKNLIIVDNIQKEANCKIILALKAFSNPVAFPLLKKYLKGSTASSLYETKLAHEYFQGEVHVYSPGYRHEEYDEITEMAHSITFNSQDQLTTFYKQGRHSPIQYGLRINPEHSEVELSIYNPCAPFSHFGVTKSNFNPECLNKINGFLIHSLCAKMDDALNRTINVIKEKFGEYLPHLDWINFGGGHLLTDPQYNINSLKECLLNFRKDYNIDIIMEPGEGIVKNCGYLVSRVLDIIDNKMKTAILDTSASAHMPDVLEVPYSPNILYPKSSTSSSHLYRLSGMSCLSGDIIGNYYFDSPLKIGDTIVFSDMAQYTSVKNTWFNGIQKPNIYYIHEESFEIKKVKTFTYEDFKSNL